MTYVQILRLLKSSPGILRIIYQYKKTKSSDYHTFLPIVGANLASVTHSSASLRNEVTMCR